MRSLHAKADASALNLPYEGEPVAAATAAPNRSAISCSASWQQRAALRDAFEASALPFRVDVVTAHELAEGFRDRVIRERIHL